MVSGGARCVALALVVAACRAGAPAAAPATAAAQPDPCRIPARDTARGAPSIGTEGAIDLRNLYRGPRSPADSLAFAHVYETLVGVSCDGRLVPAIAARWTDAGDTSGLTWRLYLREDATFHGGVRIDPEDVVAAWHERAEGAAAENDPRGLAVQAVTVEADRALTVRFRDPQRYGPRALADPWFAVHAPSAQYPEVRLGTGPASAPLPGAISPEDGSLHLTRRWPWERQSAFSILRLIPGNDPRDLLDRGVNVLRTRDRRTIEYAAARRDLRVQALPADRAYVLVSPARHYAARAASTPEASGYPPASDPRWSPLRAGLARDILRTSDEQRVHDWWVSSAEVVGCATTQPHRTPRWTAAATQRRPRRLVYEASDRTAADLAERLVVLAASEGAQPAEAISLTTLLPELRPGDERILAAGVGDSAHATGLLAGDDAAYILQLPRRVFDACAAWRSLAMRAPWLGPRDVAFIVESAPALITNARAPALRIDWIGMLRVAEPTLAASPRQ